MFFSTETTRLLSEVIIVFISSNFPTLFSTPCSLTSILETSFKIVFKRTLILVLSSACRVVSVEKNIINCQAKITEVENSVQGVGNLFDNLKSDCDKNKTEVIKVGKKFDSLKPFSLSVCD
jgi:hypothetical protein